MKLYYCLVLLLPFWLTDWVKYESVDGQFELSTPDSLRLKIDTIETEIGDLYYHTLFTQGDETVGNQVYMLSYCDYPEGTIHSDSTEILKDFFKTTIRTAAYMVDGELMYQTDDDSYGYPGKYWRVDYRNRQAVIKTHAFVADNRYYALQVVSTKALHVNKDTDRFFDSFELLK
ncbi:MAG: hypothetical protein AAGI49_03705 [Bacteroidota bacterium]